MRDKNRSEKVHLLALLALLILFTWRTVAQSTAGESEISLNLPAETAGEWRASSQSEVKNRDQWIIATESAQGDILAEYGLKRVITRRYRHRNWNSIVRVFIFRQTAGAYGWWTFVRREGGAGKSSRQQGPVMIEAVVEGNGESAGEGLGEAPLSSLLDDLTKLLPPNNGQTPVLLAHLPGVEAGLVAGSETYLVGPKALARDALLAGRTSLIEFSGLPDIVTADYRRGATSARLLLVEYHTPQAATESLRRWEEDLGRQPALPEMTRTVKRIGNYIAELTGNSDQSFTADILGKIRYEQRIYWAGKKVSDIPLQFRPLDSSVLREATRTGTIIVQSLIWIGMMMIIIFGAGLLVGGIFFYWRRFSQQRKGTDNHFSDGGGSIVLNLHDKE
ncbi:MAG: DUF6599 family protein [Blastocatellia bacterium]